MAHRHAVGNAVADAVAVESDLFRQVAIVFSNSYFNIHKLSAITAMPATTPTMLRCSSPKERETGTSSSTEMKTMMPATAARTTPSTASLRNGIRTSAARLAPTGSARPDRNDYRKALPRLPVAA